jgi:hypothetical protein
MKSDVDALIVGLGRWPDLLGQWGVRTLAIDRDTEVCRLPRAVHFDHENNAAVSAIGDRRLDH